MVLFISFLLWNLGLFLAEKLYFIFEDIPPWREDSVIIEEGVIYKVATSGDLVSSLRI